MGRAYSEALALIEAGKQMALGAVKEKPMRTIEKKDKPQELDILALMEKKRREYLALKNFVDEQAKLGKPDKEEKKESVFNVRNIALALIASSPITGPLYVWWFRLLMGT